MGLDLADFDLIRLHPGNADLLIGVASSAELLEPRPKLICELVHKIQRNDCNILLTEQSRDELMPGIFRNRLNFRHRREFRVGCLPSNTSHGVGENFRL